MSNYIARTRFCPTGEIADAEWLDGYFGRRVYGVRFPDGRIHHESQCEEVSKKSSEKSSDPAPESLH